MISEELRDNNRTNKQQGKQEQNGAKCSSVTTEMKRGGSDLRVRTLCWEWAVHRDRGKQTSAAPAYKMALNGNLVTASNAPSHNSIFKLLTFFLSMGYLTQLGRTEVQQTGQNNYKNNKKLTGTFQIKYNYTNKILNWDSLKCKVFYKNKILTRPLLFITLLHGDNQSLQSSTTPPKRTTGGNVLTLMYWDLTELNWFGCPQT